MKLTGSPPRLVWRDVSKTYGARPVWQHLEGALDPGEVLVVSGANGAGKSTFLRLLCGLEPPTSGAVAYELGGARRTPREMRPLLGLVAPDIALYRELTALEHLRFFATVRGLGQTELLRGLAAVGLGGREHDRVATFSSGMALRLKYALATIHQPPVLLLDEPTAMLDEAGRGLVEEIIAAQRRRGLCVVATNDQRELAWGDLVLRLG